MNQELVSRYLANRCTPEEVKEIESWLTDPANAKVVESHMQEYWNTVPQYAPTPDLTPLLTNILNQVDKQVNKEKEVPISVAPWRSLLYLKLAATFLVLMICLAVVVVLSRERGFDSVETQSWLQHETTIMPDGVAGEIVLSDGTKVWLNAKSTLKYAETFEGQKREVYLEGEAYFDVAEDKTRPFVVYTNDIHVTVLGTAFTVKSYKDDATSEAVLVRGKVLVEKQNLLTRETQLLKPNERAVFNRDSKTISVSNVTASDFTTWREGTLRFEGEPISNVLRTLERWYGVEIVFQDSPPTTCVLTARIHQETLAETLDLLRYSTGVEYEVADSVVYLKGAMCDN